MGIDTQANRINLYQSLSKMDIVAKLLPILTRRGYIVKPDGKIDLPVHHLAWQSPWIHSHQDNFNDCSLWYTVFDNIDKKFWPKHCAGCWKVVVSPRTLIELFDLYEFQQEAGHPSKCGIETRKTVPRLYGGYFYNDSKKEGLETYKRVRAAMPIGVGVILKRGCSEMEEELGPVEEWEFTDEQTEFEKLLRAWFPIPQDRFIQPPYVHSHIMLKWIHWAWEHGDDTYRFFTNWLPLSRPKKTYHQEIDNDGEMAKRHNVGPGSGLAKDER